MILRIFLGFFITPMVVAVVFAFGEYLSVKGYPGPNLTFEEALLGGILLAAPFSYFTMLVAGVPIFFLFRKLGWLKLWIVSFAGGIGGALIGGILIGTTIISLLALSTFCGLIAGAIFWLIACWQPNQPLNSEREKVGSGLENSE